ncbi:hypothetical protein BU16DRAFT_559280 [Lophium mytilinum]|uniref:Uncharacterized protein n=1 Tax=Lophium mytilinum TaxID=390894 RepID=A0A6A6QZ65_9PEZI|nr:hypothetical protein BU16DRAFT_559280 [Lophium mytilinum]
MCIIYYNTYLLCECHGGPVTKARDNNIQYRCPDHKGKLAEADDQSIDPNTSPCLAGKEEEEIQVHTHGCPTCQPKLEGRNQYWTNEFRKLIEVNLENPPKDWAIRCFGCDVCQTVTRNVNAIYREHGIDDSRLMNESDLSDKSSSDEGLMMKGKPDEYVVQKNESSEDSSDGGLTMPLGKGKGKGKVGGSS